MQGAAEVKRSFVWFRIDKSVISEGSFGGCYVNILTLSYFLIPNLHLIMQLDFFLARCA